MQFYKRLLWTSIITILVLHFTTHFTFFAINTDLETKID